MAKFNVIQKQRRLKIQELKRAIHGDPSSGKLKIKPQPLSISGKRKRKMFKKWRRDQKDALQQGLITMQDVEMAIADGTSQDSSDKAPMKFKMKKKGGKLKIKKLGRKGKSGRNSSEPAAGAVAVVPVDAMAE